MKIVIVGAGGLGSYVGAVLDQAGNDVTLVIRGDHRTIVESDGLRVRSHAGDFVAHPRCVASAVDIESADLAFLATKTFSVDDVAEQITHLVEVGADVVSLLNGVTAIDRLAAHGVPADRLGDGVAYMTSFRVEPGVVERKAAHQRIVVGAGRIADRVAQAFDGTLVDIEVTEKVKVELWQKMAVVCSLSVLCALGGRNMGSVRRHAFGAELQRAAIGEVLAVGRAQGVPIAAEADFEIDAILDEFPDDFFPSVIHDLNHGRPTEMDDLGGVVSRLGRRAGVPTPLHDAGTLVVQTAEATAAGRPVR